MIKHTGAVVCALVIAAAATGCNQQEDGSPQAQPSASETSAAAATGEVDAAELNPGNYPTKPLAPLGAADSPRRGAVLEAQRLADAVVGPWEVDAAIAEPHTFSPTVGNAGPILPDALTPLLAPEAAKAGEPGYVTGFASARELKDQTVLFNAVFEYADPQAAAKAGHDMPQAMLDFAGTQDIRIGTTLREIPGHDDAFAVAYTYPVAGTDRVWNTVDSFTEHGPFVLMQRAQSMDSMQAATDLVARTLAAQKPVIDEFQPTPQADLPSLPKDPSGLLARALPTTRAETWNSNATFGPRAMLHFEVDPEAAGTAYGDAGVDLGVTSDGWVYRTRDNAAAKSLAAEFADTQGGTSTPAEAVPNLPDSTCYQDAASQNFVCTAAMDQYMFMLYGPRLDDVHQKAAAQYLMLAAK